LLGIGMNDPLDQFRPDPDLTEEQKHLISLLTEEQTCEIDEMLLSFVCERNRKLARVVGSLMLELPERVNGASDSVKNLVNRVKVVAEGNLDSMRFS